MGITRTMTIVLWCAMTWAKVPLEAVTNASGAEDAVAAAERAAERGIRRRDVSAFAEALQGRLVALTSPSPGVAPVPRLDPEALELAVRLCDAFVVLFPEDPQVDVVAQKQGEVLLALGRYDQAWAAYTRAYELDPTGPRASYAAEAAANAARKASGDQASTIPRRRRGEAAEPLTEWDERTIEAWERAAALANGARARNAQLGIASVHYMRGRFEAAIPVLDALAVAAPGTTEGTVAADLAVQSYLMLGDLDGARGAIERYLAIPGLGDDVFRAALRNHALEIDQKVAAPPR
jgi:tetratricopeptide (TPR) repeat protein